MKTTKKKKKRKKEQDASSLLTASKSFKCENHMPVVYFEKVEIV